MISAILSWLSSFVIGVISAIGYPGIFVLMALSSACIPIPSEIVMPFSGFLVWQERFHFWPVVLWAMAGDLVGASLSYVIGRWGGRSLIIKYGRYFLISIRDLEITENWFKKYGEITVFFGRFLPIVRAFVSLPAGIAQMDFRKFCGYTLAGSFLWASVLAYAGLVAGENWDFLKIYFHKFDLLIGALIVLAVVWWFWRHVNQETRNS
jgi:membrane protein DedA with SNARE-associated domain